jgi:hypothetical protein
MIRKHDTGNPDVRRGCGSALSHPSLSGTRRNPPQTAEKARAA